MERTALLRESIPTTGGVCDCKDGETACCSSKRVKREGPFKVFRMVLDRQRNG